jgi:hypothetical protein
MSWVAVAVAAVGVVTTAVSADGQRKAANRQNRAIEDAKAADDAQKAEAEAGANAALVARKKRRLAGQSMLATGDASASVLGSAPATDGRMMAPRTPRTTLGGM